MGSRVKKSLAESLLSLPDPRGFQGRDHRLPSIIMLIILGKLCGEKSMAGIQRFGRLLSKKQKAKLGFIKHNTPALGTLTETMKAVDAVALQSILSQAMHKGKTIQRTQVQPFLLNQLVLISPKQSNISFQAKPQFNFAGSFQGHLCTGQMESVPAGKYAKQSLIWLAAS